MSPSSRVDAQNTRQEHDLLGDWQVPMNAYYGVHTSRALENFQITGTPVHTFPDLIYALVSVKQAAASANLELGLLDTERANAIIGACEAIRVGTLREQFCVDVIQGGAGTSLNMNANEVIANLALEMLGREKGAYHYLHPIEHVNLGQSTNDVYPTALRLASSLGLLKLIDAMSELRDCFHAKALEFGNIVKIGRTQLQDAVPMTLGQEFGTYSEMTTEDIARLRETLKLCEEINLGGTAIGTGINAHPDYKGLVCRKLGEITGLPLITAPNLIEATQDCGVFVQVSGVLKRVAVKLSKCCNDLRLLSSGPRAGFNEINLPPVQAGSSIMPGKVNPVIPEVVNQVAFEVIGNDVSITFAAEAGQLQLNAFEPIIAYSLFNSLEHLLAACLTLSRKCVSGITANEDVLDRYVLESIGLATALNPYIGYANATAIARDALASGRPIRQLVLERKLLSRQKLDEIFTAKILTGNHG